MKKPIQHTNPILFVLIMAGVILLRPVHVGAQGQDREFEEVGPDSVMVEPTFPAVRQVQPETAASGRRVLEFASDERANEFTAAFERRFGKPVTGEAGAQWRNLSYEPWGIGDVTVSIAMRKRQAADVQEQFEVRIQVDVPAGEAAEESLDTIQEWFQRLVNASFTTALRSSEGFDDGGR